MSRITFPVVASLLAVSLLAGCGKRVTVEDEAAALYEKADEVAKAGNQQQALELLGQSIAKKPASWNYLKRARLHMDLGNESAALDDCNAGLQLDPQDTDLQWLSAELKKPKKTRFKGAASEPPSASK